MSSNREPTRSFSSSVFRHLFFGRSNRKNKCGGCVPPLLTPEQRGGRNQSPRHTFNHSTRCHSHYTSITPKPRYQSSSNLLYLRVIHVIGTSTHAYTYTFSCLATESAATFNLSPQANKQLGCLRKAPR